MRWVHLAWLLPVYVFLSSWIGLTRESLFRNPGGAFEFFGNVWGPMGWPGADIVFVLGSLIVGAATLGGLLWASRQERSMAIAASFLIPAASIPANWVVYAFSFMALDFGGARGSPGQSMGEAFQFVWEWGWPGLVWVAVLCTIGSLVMMNMKPQAMMGKSAATPIVGGTRK